MALVVIAATATTAAKSFSSTPTTARASGIRLWLRFINLECAPPQVGAIQRGYRLIRFGGVCHFHEGEATRAAGFPVHHYTHLLDSSV
jgi:hypothetical protein